MNMLVGVALAGEVIPQKVIAAVAEIDPIFAAIEAHKAARATWICWVDRHMALEAELPKDKRQSTVNAWDNEIVLSDDPRWIEAERELSLTSDAEEEAACELVSVRPTTMAGLLALLNHALVYDTDGKGWPRDLCSDDGKRRRPWQTFLLENITDALTTGLDQPSFS